ncbi:MAG: hypothetical protein A3I05_03105 [Deltaproteobacteria bacterium RIFCSPLOWO2_02_FULL_44_10]|nr:MAG: hypothetical protein A3C46_09015 [Deltaproteobacteria bacterium RIFCSPHIGHO2_02_FULL_44_16]OGQ46869.1 MAG: hypothetical protein A3I05_03105 [Deltaproteobacteria bacterium RIFCSPLOWO2_02_FULL_44_10]
MADVFHYLDFRLFLKDAFEELKKRRERFSYRAFSRLAGFRSSNFLMLVIQGKRNLSGDGIQKVARALKLKKEEVDFFENLVRFHQSSNDEERNFYYARIGKHRRYLEARKIQQEQFEYYSKWYHSVVQELVLFPGFRKDPEWIARQFDPFLTIREAGESFALLEKLGFVVRGEDGKYRQQHRHLQTDDEVMSLAIANYHRQMIERAGESIDKTPAEHREISSVTFAVSKERLKRLKEMLQEFRKKVSHFLAEENEAEAVYQLNFQLFNVSRLPKE